MLTVQFLLVNINFAVCMAAALVFFAIFWLYWDAWQNNKDIKRSLPFVGFFLLSVSYVAQALIFDQSLLTQPLLASNFLTSILSVSRITGYLSLIISQIITPLQPTPEYKNSTKETAPIFLLSLASFSFAPLAALTGLMYLRRASRGYETHLLPISIAFFVLSLSDVAGLAKIFRIS